MSIKININIFGLMYHIWIRIVIDVFVYFKVHEDSDGAFFCGTILTSG